MHTMMRLMPALEVTSHMVNEVSEEAIAKSVDMGTGLPEAGRRQRRSNRRRR